MSWARLDDGDTSGEPCWIRTSDPLLKSAESRQTEYHTLLNLLGFSSHFSPQSNSEQRPFGGSSRTEGGQSREFEVTGDEVVVPALELSQLVAEARSLLPTARI
jgi:hypothetical protein